MATLKLQPLHADPASSTSPGPPSDRDVWMDDWSVLFNAVTTKLRFCVDEPHPPHLMRGEVLECIDALHQLHATLRQELARYLVLDPGLHAELEHSQHRPARDAQVASASDTRAMSQAPVPSSIQPQETSGRIQTD